MYRLVILGLVCLSNILWAQKSMVLEVSTDSLLTNDPFEITITVENINSPSIPELPIGEGLKLVSGPNLSQSMRSINGLQTTTTSVSYVLFAAEPMVYEIEPLRIEDAGESFSTEPMTLIIQENETGLQRWPPKQEPSIFSFDLFNEFDHPHQAPKEKPKKRKVTRL